MNREAFKLARDTLRLAVKEYGWLRQYDKAGYSVRYLYGPGKFEGEHWTVVHYYDAVMNGWGFTDEAFTYPDGTVAADILGVTDIERDAFKLNADTQFVVLWYSDSGFVSMQELTATEYDELREAWERDHPIEDEPS